MVNDFNGTRYCRECQGEIVRDGDVITMYTGKKICKRNKVQDYCSKQTQSKKGDGE